MNDITLQALFKIIKAVLNNRTPQIDEYNEIDWDSLADFVKFHEITGLVSGCIAGIDIVPDQARKRFADFEMVNIFREANQELEVEKILSDFERDGIEHMPLKGFVMKKLYPSVEMRDMCDVDILIKEKHIDKVRPIMEENGFTFYTESRHEFVYRSNITTIELHKSLVPTYNKDLFRYYGDGWKTAKKKDGFSYQYEMSPEDFYIYSVVHTAKHYLNGGTGIKQVVDTYVLNHAPKYMERDNAYVTGELKKLRLDVFEDSLRQLSEVWFGDAEYTQTTADMANYIINSGAWGISERADISKIYREGGNRNKTGRIRMIMHMLFPDMVSMKNRYSILRHHPYFYPVMAVVRIIEALFNKDSHMKDNMDLVKNTDNSSLDSFAMHCETVGLKRTL